MPSSKIKEAEAVFKTTQEKVRHQPQIGRGPAASIQGDIERLEAELKQCEAELPDLIRDTYLRMVRQKGEDALAEVVEGACSGCYQQVPVNVQANIRLLQPSFCRSCGRLLYVAEEKV